MRLSSMYFHFIYTLHAHMITHRTYALNIRMSLSVSSHVGIRKLPWNGVARQHIFAPSGPCDIFAKNLVPKICEPLQTNAQAAETLQCCRYFQILAITPQGTDDAWMVSLCFRTRMTKKCCRIQCIGIRKNKKNHSQCIFLPTKEGIFHQKPLFFN